MIRNIGNKSIIKLYLAKGLSSGANILVIPFILKILGPYDWTQLIVYQSVAVILVPLINLDWLKNGPIKLMKGEQSECILEQSIVEKSLSFIIIVVLTVLVYSLFFGNELLFLLGFFYTLSSALSNEWHYVYHGKFTKLIFKESLPRFIVNFIPLLFIHSINALKMYFVLSIIASLTTFTFVGIKLRVSKILEIEVNKNRLHYLLSQIGNYSVLFSPIPLMNVFKFPNLFTFIFYDKIFRFIMTFLLPISQQLHFEIASGKEIEKVIKIWRSRYLFFATAIIFSYYLFLKIYIVISDVTSSLYSTLIMGIVFLISILITFANRLIEEFFLLSLLDQSKLTRMNLRNMLNFFLLITIAIQFRSVIVMQLALIAMESLRMLYMLKVLKKIEMKNP